MLILFSHTRQRSGNCKSDSTEVGNRHIYPKSEEMIANPSHRSCGPCLTLLPPCQGPVWTAGGSEWRSDRLVGSPYPHYLVCISPESSKAQLESLRSKKHRFLKRFHQNHKRLIKAIIYFFFHNLLFSFLHGSYTAIIWRYT